MKNLNEKMDDLNNNQDVEAEVMVDEEVNEMEQIEQDNSLADKMLQEKREVDEKINSNAIPENKNLVKLQGVYGHQKGTPAKNLKIGDILVWNGGVTSEVIGIQPSKTGKTAIFQMKSNNGDVYDRRMKMETLVVVQNMEPAKQPAYEAENMLQEKQRVDEEIDSKEWNLLLENDTWMKLEQPRKLSPEFFDSPDIKDVQLLYELEETAKREIIDDVDYAAKIPEGIPSEFYAGMVEGEKRLIFKQYFADHEIFHTSRQATVAYMAGSKSLKELAEGIYDDLSDLVSLTVDEEHLNHGVESSLTEEAKMRELKQDDNIQNKELSQQEKLQIAIESTIDYVDPKIGFTSGATKDMPAGTKYRLVTYGEDGRLVPYQESSIIYNDRTKVQDYVKEHRDKLELISYDEMVYLAGKKITEYNMERNRLVDEGLHSFQFDDEGYLYFSITVNDYDYDGLYRIYAPADGKNRELVSINNGESEPFFEENWELIRRHLERYVNNHPLIGADGEEIPREKASIYCEWSEHEAFEEGKVYSVSDFDQLMKQADSEWVSLREEEMEELNDPENTINVRDGIGNHLGYAKVKFTIYVPKMGPLTLRQDVGDGFGGVIDYIRATSHKHYAEPLEAAIGKEIEESEDVINKPELEPPYVKCEWSKNTVFEDGRYYAVSEFDRIMRKENEEKASERIVLDDYKNQNMTRFTLYMPDGQEITESYDIGDTLGGLIEFLELNSTYNSGYFDIVKKKVEDELSEQEKLFQSINNFEMDEGYLHFSISSLDGYTMDGLYRVYDPESGKEFSLVSVDTDGHSHSEIDKYWEAIEDKITTMLKEQYYNFVLYKNGSVEFHAFKTVEEYLTYEKEISQRNSIEKLASSYGNGLTRIKTREESTFAEIYDDLVKKSDVEEQKREKVLEGRESIEEKESVSEQPEPEISISNYESNEPGKIDFDVNIDEDEVHKGQAAFEDDGTVNWVFVDPVPANEDMNSQASEKVLNIDWDRVIGKVTELLQDLWHKSKEFVRTLESRSRTNSRTYTQNVQSDASADPGNFNHQSKSAPDAGPDKSFMEQQEKHSEHAEVKEDDVSANSSTDRKKNVMEEAAVTTENIYKEFSDAHKQSIQNTEVNRIPVVINAFGGPGSSKSVSCMDICQQLKKQGYNAEYVQEYAKELVYDENWKMLDGSPENQFEILKEQLHRIDRLYGKVDFIVTDSPILLNGVYNKSLTTEYDAMVTSLHNDFENFTYFMERDASAFQQEGRIHNLEESQKIDQNVKQLLKEKEIHYGTYNHDTIDKIVSDSIRTFNRINHIGEEPTKKQIAYAEKIAKALNIKLPEEKTKAAYNTFISENKENFERNDTPLREEGTDSNGYQDYLDMVEKNGSTLKDVPQEYYTDELLLAAVSNWGAAIRVIPQERITAEIALASVRQYGLNLKYVPAEFRNEEICIAAYISSSGKSVRYTPNDIKDKVKDQGQKQLAENNRFNPNLKRQLEKEQLTEQGQKWLSEIGNMLKEHESNPEAMIEDISFASKFYKYSIRNIQLMRRQNQGITYVASASAFEKMGYHVKENESAMIGRVPVYSKYIINEKNERVYSWNYTPEIRQKLKEGTLTEKQAIKKFQFVAAFYDISQTDCPVEDYPSIYHMGVPSELHQEAFDAMKEFAESLGFKVMVTDMRSISLRGNCEPDNRIIRINDKLEATMALSTLCHEIAHGIIHTSEESGIMSTAQKECEADVMDVMLESSLGLPINESRRDHLFKSFHAYKEEQRAKERPYEVTLENLIDRVQSKVFRPYVEDINYYLDQYLPAEGSQNEVAAKEVVKNIALLDSAYNTDYRALIAGDNELFDTGRIDSYQELYQQTREEYRLSNSFVPKLAVMKLLAAGEGFTDTGDLWDLCDIQLLDEATVEMIRMHPEKITPESLINVRVGNIIALKENVLSGSRIYLVTGEGLQDVTETLQKPFAAIESKINCGLDAQTEYHCLRNLLENGIKLEPARMKMYEHLCEVFAFPKNPAEDSSMRLMARINLVAEGLSPNNRELITEYVFRTGNFEKAEKYADRLEKEPDSVKRLLQEMKLVDSYKYMLWTIEDYESNNSVSEAERITTGAYNTSSMPILSENVSSLSQINERFLLIRKHASSESVKYYAIVEKEDVYRIAYVELNEYRPETTYSTVAFTNYEEAKEFYNRYLETQNSRLVDGTQADELVALEHRANQIALSDITSIGKTIASQKYQYKELGMSEEAALEMLRAEISTEYPIIIQNEKVNDMENTGLEFKWESGSKNDNAMKVFQEKDIPFMYNRFGNLTADFHKLGVYEKVEYVDLGNDTFGIFIETKETDREIQVLKDFKKTVSHYGEEHFVELSCLQFYETGNDMDVAVMEESLQLAEWLREQRDILENINVTGIDDVTLCVDAALNGAVMASDVEKAFNVIDAAILSAEFSNLEAEFEGFEEYNDVLDTLKSSHVTPDKFCYTDYAAVPGPFLYTSDPAGNIYRKSLRNEWSGSVQELHTRLKESGYEICTSLDDFKAYAANNRLGISGASQKEKSEAYIRILESTSDMLPKNQILSVYEFKNTIDKLSGATDFHEDITYKLVTRKNQEIHSYIDTYSGDGEQNVYEQLYGKVQEQEPELSKVISKQYYQDQLNFNERHLVRPLLEQLKKQQKSVEDSEELNALMDSNDKLKEEIKKLDLSPADAEVLKLNAGNIKTEQLANIERQQQMNQQAQQRKTRNRQQEGISLQ